MTPRRTGSLHLFEAFGIDVYVHWSWFLVAGLLYMNASAMGGAAGFVATYASLFVIVVMHEFGHALACRSVGGKADLIVLWPLGGVAYVEPPPRPGANLWSIAAGPLVNVVLVPVTLGLYAIAGLTAGQQASVTEFLGFVVVINLVLLVFNALPIYPLDGGQVLQSILWFFIGWARALRTAATIGLVVAIAVGLALISGALFFDAGGEIFLIRLAMAVFIGWQAWVGREAANRMAKQEEQSRQNLKRKAREMAEPFGRRADER